MKNKCRLVVFSDVHYLKEIPEDKDKLSHLALPLLDILVDKINNEIKPDMAFCLGDLIDDHNDKVYDAENLNVVKSKLDQAICPIHICSGNHDIQPYDSRAELEKVLNMGHSTYSIDLNGYHFVILGLHIDESFDRSISSIPRTNVLSKEDLEWLEKDLASTNNPTIIFSHYGLIEDKMDFAWDWFVVHPDTAYYRNSEKIKNILNSSGKVIACFNGHQHWTKTYIENKIPYFSVGSLTDNVYHDGLPDGMYYIVDLEENDVTVLDRHIRLNAK